VLLPLLLLAAFPFFGILLGSLGVDIHWNASRASGYAAAFCVVLLLCISNLRRLAPSSIQRPRILTIASGLSFALTTAPVKRDFQ
jgi:uncharacterized membrane protein